MVEKESNLFRKSSLERVSSPEQLNEYIKITNPSLIVILIGIFSIVISGAIWIFAGGIPKTVEINGVVVTDQSGTNTLHCFVPIGKSKQIKEGKDAEVSPDYADRSQYGYIKGKVLSVSDEMVTDDYLFKNFSNPQLVEAAVARSMQLSGSNVVEVKISMGEWSNEKGKSIEVTGGANCGALVVLDEIKPYDLVFGNGKIDSK